MSRAEHWAWRLALGASLALLGATVHVGCSAAQLAGWQAALAAFDVAAPDTCIFVNDAAGAPAASVCSKIAADATGFAAWLQSVLATVPAAPAAKAKAAPPVHYEAGTVQVDLRADLVAEVARAKAGK